MLVFVYGTLMPGHLRWPTIRSAVLAARPALVAGALYDTGAGYPAACFDPSSAEAGGQVVPGWVLRIEATRFDRLLVLLDGVEGPQYERVPVVTTDGEPAIAYGWLRSVTGLRSLPEGWTLAREER